MTRRSRRWAATLLLVPAMAGAQASTFVSLDSSAGITQLDTRITARFERTELRAAVAEIARLASLRLTFDPDLPGLASLVTRIFTNTTARSALDQVLDGSPVNARVSASGQLVLTATSRRAEAKPVAVQGAIRSTEGAALGGAHVDLAGTRFSTLSRDDGLFALGDVPPGRYTLRALRIGFAPVTRQVVVGPRVERIDVTLTPAAIPLAAVVVTPAYYGLMTSTVATSAVLDHQQLETVPQIGEDVYRAMSRLPGVVADEASAEFSVRGASGSELYVTLDGLQLIEPFHLRDLRNALSIIDIRTLDHVELIAGGAPVEYGDHTAGVLRMTTIDPPTSGVRVSTGVSVMNARVSVEGGFAHGKGGWLVSARRGYLDLAFKILALTDSMNPWYYDGIAKVQYDAGRYGKLSVEALTAQDRLTYQDGNHTLRSRYPSGYVWTRWQTGIGARLTQQLVLSSANLSWQRDASAFEQNVRTLVIHDRRTLNRLSARDDWTLSLSERALLRFGVEAATERASYDYASVIRRYGVVGDAIAERTDTTTVALTPSNARTSGYVALRTRASALTVEGGVRFDRATSGGDALWSPRLNASWDLGHGASLRGAWGRYAQPEPLYALQAANGVQQFAPADRAEQREVGLDLELPRAFAFRAQAYERTMSDERARWVNTGALLDAVPEVAIDRTLIDASTGLARGLELTLGRRRADHVEWNVGYVLSKVTDDVGGVDIPRATDQRHGLQLDAAFHPTSNVWRLAAAAVWHSGRPFTPDSVTLDTLVNTANQFSLRSVHLPGGLNSQRTPSYARVDVRWTRYVDGRHGRLMFFAEVFNLFNTKNSRGNVTAVSVNGRSVSLLPDPKEMIGRFPTAGVTWAF